MKAIHLKLITLISATPHFIHEVAVDGIRLAPVAHLELDSHADNGGAGVGLGRVVMLFCGRDNIR